MQYLRCSTDCVCNILPRCTVMESHDQATLDNSVTLPNLQNYCQLDRSCHISGCGYWLGDFNRVSCAVVCTFQPLTYGLRLSSYGKSRPRYLIRCAVWSTQLQRWLFRILRQLDHPTCSEIVETVSSKIFEGCIIHRTQVSNCWNLKVYFLPSMPQISGQGPSQN